MVPFWLLGLFEGVYLNMMKIFNYLIIAGAKKKNTMYYSRTRLYSLTSFKGPAKLSRYNRCSLYKLDWVKGDDFVGRDQSEFLLQPCACYNQILIPVIVRYILITS